MTAYLLLNHLLNFMAPALAVAVLLVLFSRLLPGGVASKRGFGQLIWVQIAINFIACLGALTAGLVLFGRDGKMLTYLALVVTAGISQWCQQRGWRR